MDHESSLVIIGAGIAGLACGCYARMNGYRTVIFEMNDQPGGLCTAWKRKGFTIDGCIHHLAGVGPRSRLYTIWRELGAISEQDIVFHDRLVRVEDTTGQSLDLYTDIDRLEVHLKELSPVDAPVIDDYIQAIRRFMNIELLALPAGSSWDLVKMLPRAGLFMKWGRLTMEEYALRFRNPFLRRAFPFLQYGFSQIPVLIHLSFMAGCAQNTLGWPRGGSLAFARAIERRYLELGGEIYYKSRARKILVENDRATGVMVENGTRHLAQRVIAAGDGHCTVYDLLEGKYLDGPLREYFEQAPDRQEMSLAVSCGVERDMDGEPSSLCLLLDEPVDVAGENRYRMDVEIFPGGTGLVPPDQALVKVMFNSRYSYWKELAGDRKRYLAEKERATEAVLNVLDRRFSGLKTQVKMTDVATPLTVERYTGNWQGQQFWPAPKAGMMKTLFKGFYPTLPGLQGVYRIGQWAGAIGISSAAISGRKMVQRLCREDKRSFRAEVAREE